MIANRDIQYGADIDRQISITLSSLSGISYIIPYKNNQYITYVPDGSGIAFSINNQNSNLYNIEKHQIFTYGDIVNFMSLLS